LTDIEKVLVVDGNNIAVRALYAAKGKMSNDEGVPTGGLLLFVNMLSKSVRDIKPTRLVVCFDGGRSIYRTDIYPDYKSSRGDTVSIPHDSFNLIERFLDLCGIAHLRRPGVEADDLVAWYWGHQDIPGRLVIFSGDKDFLQLIDTQTTVHTPTGEVWDTERVRRERGCEPHQITLVMALTGDKVDGIPGVFRVGPVTAVKLLRKYAWNLPALLNSGEPKIEGYQDDILRNLELVNLRTSGLYLDALPVPELFTPTDMSSSQWGDLSSFLDRYQLKNTKEKLVNGSLWRDPIDNSQSASNRFRLDPRLLEDLDRYADTSSDNFSYGSPC